MALELPAYQRKENWGAAETFYQLVRALAGTPAADAPPRPPASARAATCWAHGAGLSPPRRRARITRPAGPPGRRRQRVRALDATPADLAA
jgi:light-independent protochlorophyllide reductase subunit B